MLTQVMVVMDVSASCVKNTVPMGALTGEMVEGVAVPTSVATLHSTLSYISSSIVRSTWNEGVMGAGRTVPAETDRIKS